MNTIAMLMVLAFGIYVFRNDGWRIIQARRNGIETDARVSRIEEVKKAADGADYYMHYYYVCFETKNGLMNEARLLNPKRSLAAGSTIRVKYLEEQNDYAVLTKIVEVQPGLTAV